MAHENTGLVGKVRAKYFEIYKKINNLVKVKDDSIWYNGENNLYPNEIEGIIANSPTAKRCVKLWGKFVSGRGFTDPTKDILVNTRKNYKLSTIASLAADEAGEQGGAFFHIGYGLNDELKLIQKSLDLLDYSKCRLSKEDDDKNEGFIIYKDFAKKTTFSDKTNKEKKYYPYNPDPLVVLSQIKADYKKSGGEKTDDLATMLPYYTGQVYYWNLTPKYKYAIAPIDTVYNDADSEARIQVYNNRGIRTGFLGKVAVLTQGLDDETAKKINEDLSKWLGEEGGDGMWRLDVEKADNLENVLKIIQLKAQIDPKLFSELKKEIRSAIMGSFNNIPEPLILAGDGSLFGTSRETYDAMKLFYSEQTEDERKKLEQCLTYLGFPCEIEPIVKKANAEESDKTLDAQAQLKGSVGGVTALIELQKSVSQGYTDRNSAVKTLEVIYGLDHETAEAMIGTPVATEPLTTETTV